MPRRKTEKTRNLSAERSNALKFLRLTKAMMPSGYGKHYGLGRTKIPSRSNPYEDGVSKDSSTFALFDLKGLSGKALEINRPCNS